MGQRGEVVVVGALDEAPAVDVGRLLDARGGLRGARVEAAAEEREAEGEALALEDGALEGGEAEGVVPRFHLRQARQSGHPRLEGRR